GSGVSDRDESLVIWQGKASHRSRRLEWRKLLPRIDRDKLESGVVYTGEGEKLAIRREFNTENRVIVVCLHIKEHARIHVPHVQGIAPVSEGFAVGRKGQPAHVAVEAMGALESTDLIPRDRIPQNDRSTSCVGACQNLAVGRGGNLGGPIET